MFAFIYINLQETLDGFLHTDRLKEKIVKVLKQIHQEKATEEVRVDMWCHFGRAYITKVDEGTDLNIVLKHIITPQGVPCVNVWEVRTLDCSIT